VGDDVLVADGGAQLRDQRGRYSTTIQSSTAVDCR
jgi:hypothetical protein